MNCIRGWWRHWNFNIFLFSQHQLKNIFVLIESFSHSGLVCNDISGITITLIWVGFLGVRFEVGGVKLPLCLKLVRILLETSNLARKYTPILVSENIPFSA